MRQLPRPRGFVAAGLLRGAPVLFLSRDRLDRGDDVLQFGDLTQGDPGWQSLMLGYREDERALVRLQGVMESVALVEYGRPVAVSEGPRQPDVVRELVIRQRTD